MNHRYGRSALPIRLVACGTARGAYHIPRFWLLMACRQQSTYTRTRRHLCSRDDDDRLKSYEVNTTLVKCRLPELSYGGLKIALLREQVRVLLVIVPSFEIAILRSPTGLSVELRFGGLRE